MDNYFGINNFRVFGNDAGLLRISPLTFITGCNNSGKSSIIRSMVLVSDYINNIKEDARIRNWIDLTKFKLDFTNSMDNILGNFNQVKNRNSDSETIDYAYIVYSYMLDMPVLVQLKFANDENDGLGNGYIKEFSFSDLDNNLIYQSIKGEGIKGNFVPLIKKYNCFKMGYTLITRHRRNSLIGINDDDERQVEEQQLKDFISKYGEDALKSIITYIDLNSNSSNGRAMFDSLLYEFFDDNCIFYIDIIKNINSIKKEEIRDKSQEWLEQYINISGDNRKGHSRKSPNGKPSDTLAIPKGLQKCFEFVIEEYITSKHKDFSSFFLEKEKEYLNNYMAPERPYISSPRLFRRRDLSRIICDFKDDDANPVEIYELIGNDTDEGKEKRFLSYDKRHLPFLFVYQTLSALKDVRNANNRRMPRHMDLSLGSGHYIFNRGAAFFEDYISYVCLEIVKQIPSRFLYNSTSVVKVKRLYSFDSNDGFTNILKNYLEARRIYSSRKHDTKTFHPEKFINIWIKKFNLGEYATMDLDEDGLGIKIRIHNDTSDTRGTLLADMGVGVTQLFLILIRICISVMETHICRISNCLDDPYEKGKKIDYIIFKDAPSIAIEEPEVHLHPKFQSMLADIIVSVNKEYDISFILETHSEYLVRKIQILVAEKKVSKDLISILYVDDPNPENRKFDAPQVKEITLDEKGILSEPFGEGFFDEADRLAIKLMDI